MNDPSVSDSASAPIEKPVTDPLVPIDATPTEPSPPPTPSSRRNWREDRNRRNGDNLLDALDFNK